MYGFSVKVSGDFNSVIEKVTEELKKVGFGILTDIDVKATLKSKLDKDMNNYRILGACNPSFAHQAIEMEPNIGLLLPCNVVVREDNAGDITVAFMDPKAVLGLVNSEKLNSVGMEVRSLLETARDAIK